jgi:hypothetical protein
LLAAKGTTGQAGVSEFFYWLNFDLKYRPSREIWLGLILLAGTNEARGQVRSLLKLDRPTQDLGTRVKGIRGASWDTFYTRLISFTQDERLLPEVPRPAVLVTEDAMMARVFENTRLWDTIETPLGRLGREWVPTNVFEQAYTDLILDQIEKSNARILNRGQSPESVVREVMRRARSLSKQLLRELDKA